MYSFVFNCIGPTGSVITVLLWFVEKSDFFCSQVDNIKYARIYTYTYFWYGFLSFCRYLSVVEENEVLTNKDSIDLEFLENLEFQRSLGFEILIKSC